MYACFCCPKRWHIAVLKSTNPPTWQAFMCLAYLHLFGNLMTSCQIRDIRQNHQIRQHGWPPCV